MENLIKNVSFIDETKYLKLRTSKARSKPIWDELIDKEHFQQSDDPKNQKNIEQYYRHLHKNRPKCAGNSTERCNYQRNVIKI